MGRRFIGAIVTTAAIVLAVSTGLSQKTQLLAQQRAPAAAPQGGQQPAAQATPQRGAQAAQQAARIGGRPNFNGIWQAIGTAHWNLEAHSAEAIQAGWRLGALAAIPAGKSVLRGGGTIPYLPDALKKRNENRTTCRSRFFRVAAMPTC
jgi:hypothetical protein